MREYFEAWLALELQQNDEAVSRYELLETAAPDNVYVLTHMALACYNSRDFNRAKDLFKKAYDIDPLCLDHTDVYSNILFLKEMRPELSHLAHRVSAIDPYRVETCCVIGNFYSLCNKHEKAVTYFHRALRLNRRYLAAWTLMGHEYLQLKNTPAAIAAYRRAVDINPRVCYPLFFEFYLSIICIVELNNILGISKDYRAWYGLGQTYELLNMAHYALYYYRQAQRLRAYDSRMWSNHTPKHLFGHVTYVPHALNSLL